MKEVYRYKSFNYMLGYLIADIFFMAMPMDKPQSVKSIMIAFGIIGAISIIFFLDEYMQAKKINKDGKFVLGVIQKESIKFRFFMKSSYIVKGEVRYFDEERKRTLVFKDYDICDIYEVSMGKIRQILADNENVEVLVGYLPEDESKCTIFFKDAFEKYV